MAIQTLDPVQVAFMNETIRPALEDLVRFKFRVDAFILDYDNQQHAIVKDADDLGEGVDGTTPRGGAPDSGAAAGNLAPALPFGTSDDLAANGRGVA